MTVGARTIYLLLLLLLALTAACADPSMSDPARDLSQYREGVPKGEGFKIAQLDSAGGSSTRKVQGIARGVLRTYSSISSGALELPATALVGPLAFARAAAAAACQQQPPQQQLRLRWRFSGVAESLATARELLHTLLGANGVPALARALEAHALLVLRDLVVADVVSLGTRDNQAVGPGDGSVGVVDVGPNRIRTRRARSCTRQSRCSRQGPSWASRCRLQARHCSRVEANSGGADKKGLSVGGERYQLEHLSGNALDSGVPVVEQPASGSHW
ncbi:hypothetical protein B0H17DRAFT_1147946 [Mycena rosella]|uniref:Uncharacterized protein n=1 Tax=Mycena rosella TaxID=1033263 RepID=A0AAD7CH70_MYCRO|nr:hypothetical protein B0H17DRAFT_1147946 [Mycena rosella]